MRRSSTMKYAALLCALLLLTSIGGVFAVWSYADGEPIAEQKISVTMGSFIFTPGEMPSGEVSLVQRLSDILNRKYVTDTLTDSLYYLINETIQVYWGGNIWSDPYVGSMDKNFMTQISALFGDIMTDFGTSFLLKRVDLNGDGYKEVAMYSTSDPLDCEQEFIGTVCVYVTVFTPILDANRQVSGYTMVCESLRGYCPEVFYGPDDPTPSFSTNDWQDDIVYYNYIDAQSYPIPEADRTYENYHLEYKVHLDGWDAYFRTTPGGKWLGQALNGKIPYLS